MDFRVLGGDGGVAVGYQTTSFLLNEDVLIDAGSVATSLSTEEQKKVDYVFISHCHLDHVKDLCFLADNMFAFRKTPIQVISVKENIDRLKKFVFNNDIWPDFSKLNNGTCNILEFVSIDSEMEVGGLKVRVFDVNHPVPAIGFIVDDGDSSILITGDTGPTDQIWEEGNKCTNLKAIFTEIAFPDNQKFVAEAAGHFTPKMFVEEMKKVTQKVPIYIYHLKPSFYNALRQEIDKLGFPNLHYLQLGDKLSF